MAVKIFVDFDGTVTPQDVGNTFFLTFGGPVYEAILRKYNEERISARECYRRGVAAIGMLPAAAAEALLDAQDLTGGFKEFVAFCGDRGIEFHILSDGFDFYIRRILGNHRVGGMSVVANVMIVSAPDAAGKSTIDVAFPHSDGECPRCACCKRNVMLTMSGENDVIVYVGEGHSDRCPVQYADIVFAKGSLQTFCQQKNISYYVYDTFHDVVIRLELLLAHRRLRKRRRAELKRREAFMAET